MNFQELRNRCLEALGQYDNQAAASSASARQSNDTILARLKLAYDALRQKAIERNAALFEEEQTFTYTAGARYVDLSAVPSPSLLHARILELGPSYPNGSHLPYDAVGRDEYEAWLREGHMPGRSVGAYFIRREKLYLLPTPGAAVELRCVYIPELDLSAITTSNWASNTPTLFPAAHHEVIALEAAMTFAAEPGQPATPGLSELHALRLQSFLIWATQGRAPGRRRIQEL